MWRISAAGGTGCRGLPDSRRDGGLDTAAGMRKRMNITDALI
jgi:hypothetical protein